ncbi:YqeG family HAD IIIA-type phosphatase [Thermopirellula anaerolimosa]
MKPNADEVPPRGVARWLRPTYYFSRISDLSPQWLQSQGLAGLLVDLDSTLKPYRQATVAPEVAAWIRSLQAAGIRLCIVSNGGRNRVSITAGELGVPFLARAWKPFPWRCREGVRLLNLEPSAVAMVGDQLFADVWAGYWAGIRTVLIVPLAPEQEPFPTRWKRGLERWFLARLGAIPRSEAARVQDGPSPEKRHD